MEEQIVWLRIVAPHFVAGIKFRGERCVNAAPILRYARNMTKAKFVAYCEKKQWAVEETYVKE